MHSDPKATTLKRTCRYFSGQFGNGLYIVKYISSHGMPLKFVMLELSNSTMNDMSSIFTVSYRGHRKETPELFLKVVLYLTFSLL